MARLGDGLIEVIRYSSRRPGLRPACGSELATQGVGVEGEAYQLLAEAVVNVLADAGMFPVTDLEKLAFQAVALGFRPDARDGAGGLGGNCLDDNLSLVWNLIAFMRSQGSARRWSSDCGKRGTRAGARRPSLRRTSSRGKRQIQVTAEDRTGPGCMSCISGTVRRPIRNGFDERPERPRDARPILSRR